MGEKLPLYYVLPPKKHRLNGLIQQDVKKVIVRDITNLKKFFTVYTGFNSVRETTIKYGNNL